MRLGISDGLQLGMSLGMSDGVCLGLLDGIRLWVADGRYRTAFFPAEESMHHDLSESKLTKSIGWRWSFGN